MKSKWVKGKWVPAKKRSKKEAPKIRRDRSTGMILSNCQTQRCFCRPKAASKAKPKCRQCNGLGLVPYFPKADRVTAIYWTDSQDRPTVKRRLPMAGLLYVEFQSKRGTVRVHLRNGELRVENENGTLKVEPRYSNQIIVEPVKIKLK